MPTIPVEAAFAPVLGAHKFNKVGRTWRRVFPDVILVVNLQKSQWSSDLYVNLGAYLRSLGTELRPPCQRCHISARLEAVVPAEQFEAARSLSSGEPPSSEAVMAFSGFGLPWLESLSSSSGVRAFLRTSRSRRMLVSNEARALVSAWPPDLAGTNGA
jgi:hypothetical protein